MSGFKTHALWGLGASVVLTTGSYIVTKQPIVAPMFGISCFAGSIFSDTDTGSIPSRIFSFIGIILASFLIYKGMDRHAAIVGIIIMATRLDKHRGLTHSYLFIGVCVVLAVLAVKGIIPIMFVLLAPFAFGLIVHRLIDYS